MVLAISVRALFCDVHEKCDGSCGNDVGYEESPLNGLEGLLSSMLIGIVGVSPTKATAQDVPRDMHWLAQQNASTWVYSPIKSLEGEIRLLRVKEALFRVDIVECDLITISLGQCEQF